MTNKINTDSYTFDGSKNLELNKLKTKEELSYSGKIEFNNLAEEFSREIDELQSKMYAHNRYGLLIIFQAMDAAGKDSTIKHVMSGVNSHGVKVFAYKKPSVNDLEHDYLWRTNINLPERCCITIFNRSYYEEVLIVKVHPELLKNSQRIPEEHTQDLDKVFKNYQN